MWRAAKCYVTKQSAAVCNVSMLPRKMELETETWTFNGGKYAHYFKLIRSKDHKNINVKCKLCPLGTKTFPPPKIQPQTSWNTYNESTTPWSPWKPTAAKVSHLWPWMTAAALRCWNSKNWIFQLNNIVAKEEGVSREPRSPRKQTTTPTCQPKGLTCWPRAKTSCLSRVVTI